MTRYEFFKNVANGTLTDEVKTYAKEYVATEDAKKAEKIAENTELVEQVTEILKAAPSTAFKSSELAGKCEVTTSKMTAILKKMDCVTIGETREGSRVVKSYKYKEA